MSFTKKIEAIETGRRKNVRLNAMVGNSLLSNVSETEVKEEDAMVNVNFYWRPGASHDTVVSILEEVIKTSKVNTDFGVLMFQNSIRNLAKLSDEKLIEELENTFRRLRNAVNHQNSQGFHHRLAIAEEQYAPELHEYFGDIAFINEIINRENKKHNMGAFKLWKTQIKGAKKVPKSNMFIPRIVNNRWREWQNNGRPGYHIGEGRASRKFAQFIRRYFSDKKNWEFPQSERL